MPDVVVWRTATPPPSALIIPQPNSGPMCIPTADGGWTVIPPKPTVILDLRKPPTVIPPTRPTVVRTDAGAVVIPGRAGTVIISSPDRITEEGITFGGEEVDFG